MILIAGGAGYIGAHINQQLAAAGYDTVVLDNESTGFRSFVQWGHFVSGDLRTIADIRRCFDAYPITAVVHTAAASIVPESIQRPDYYYSNNVMGTANLIAVMQDYGVRDFVFSSTCAVYGDHRDPIAETQACQPLTPYGNTKRAIEWLLADYHAAGLLRYVAFRYFNAAGADPGGTIGEAHNPETHLIPLCLDAIMGNRPALTIFGRDYDTPDGTCIRDYCHVNDIAAAHVLGLQALKTTDISGCYNLGLGTGYSVLDIIQAVESVTGQSVPVVWGDRRVGDAPQLVAQPGAFAQHTGWTPEYTNIQTIIQTAWQWHQASKTCMHMN